ncbi:hypothetical protein HF313_26485 [Massilia atriviolacea]|uniref:Uncharacterized protein n=1 Tax=Massilia atriviolacea TaxID=2495579 RepID=A0A430HML7_9BURK|nr:hypothetical protein [Massilia atriviolacea]RSZ58798.1 hypothetical protein EJB06_10610 [Massilia atriviolacea]
MRAALLTVCSLAMWCASAGAGAHLGELDVRAGSGGMPCFTIFQKDERRFGAPEFRSISVSEVTAAGKSLMWAMTIPPERPFQVTFRLCIPYAGRLPVLPKTTALPLQPGKVYEALIDITPPMPSSAPRAYRARFCLSGKADGPLQVRTLNSGAPDGKGRGGCPG